MPLKSRPSSMPWSIFRDALDRAAADPDLTDELSAALPETTDEA